MTVNIINGNWQTREITFDGVLLDPQPGHGLWSCPEGFIWGYEGNGPDQLGIALVYHLTKSEALALDLRAAIRDQVLVNLPMDDFSMEFDLGEWIYQTLSYRANLVIPNVTDPGNPVAAHKYLFESKVNGFITAALGMSETMIRKCVEEASFQAPEEKDIKIAPHVFISRDKRTIQGVILNYPDVPTYEQYLQDTLSVSPRFMAFTFDGVKEPETEPDSPDQGEVSAYLVFILTPHEIPHVYEFEYGLEDGGWVANPIRLNLEGGYLHTLTESLYRIYSKNLGL